MPDIPLPLGHWLLSGDSSGVMGLVRPWMAGSPDTLMSVTPLSPKTGPPPHPPKLSCLPEGESKTLFPQGCWLLGEILHGNGA